MTREVVIYGPPVHAARLALMLAATGRGRAAHRRPHGRHPNGTLHMLLKVES